MSLDSELLGSLGPAGALSLAGDVSQVRAWVQRNANADTPAALTALENAL